MSSPGQRSEICARDAFRNVSPWEGRRTQDGFSLNEKSVDLMDKSTQKVAKA